MKKIKKILFTIVCFLTGTLVHGQIDRNLMMGNWREGKGKYIYTNFVFRHEGRNDIGGVTNIGYQTPQQLQSEILEKAYNQMWNKEKTEQTLRDFDPKKISFIIHFYLTRLTINAANTENFTLIVMDSLNQNELYRKQLDSNVPEIPPYGSSYWWNYDMIDVPGGMSGKVYIYIIDNRSRDNNRFLFEINL